MNFLIFAVLQFSKKKFQEFFKFEQIKNYFGLSKKKIYIYFNHPRNEN